MLPIPNPCAQAPNLEFMTIEERNDSAQLLTPLNDPIQTQEAYQMFEGVTGQMAARLQRIDMSFLYVGAKRRCAKIRDANV